ncbi:MAG: hypothetical protein JRC60_07995, partial [Deltaproteobacteria bacterium]|nr:hypothetical protein [Deltaproteobacteria bacterium]
YERAKKLLSDNIDTLHKLSKELLEKEVLNAEELDEIVGEKKKKKSRKVKAGKAEKEA